MKLYTLAGPEAKGERFKVELLLREGLRGLNRRLSLLQELAVFFD